MEIISQSIKLLMINYKKPEAPKGSSVSRVEAKSAGLRSNRNLALPKRKTKKELAEEERIRKEEAEEEEQRRALKKDPFAHNEKLKGVGKVIEKI